MAEPKRLVADDLVRAIRGTNPFRNNRVSSPEDVRVDVGQVHGPAFARLTGRIGDVRAGGTASGILVVGASGTGKSHLLGRLARWSRENGAAFVFLHNLQASPDRMPRYVLKAAISAVFSFQHGNQGHAGLFKLLLHAMGRHEALAARDSVDPVDPEISAVLDAFIQASKDPSQAALAEAAVDWMSGDEIDPEQAAALGELAGRKVSAQLADGAAVERVLIVLAGLLALDDKTLVLCLDQIDNLDADQVRALMAFLHALIDHGQHLVVICAGVRTNIYRLRDEGIISEAAWDRVAEHVVELQEVSSHEAHGLIEARVRDFRAPFSGLKALDGPVSRDPLFPLGRPWFEATFGQKLQVRPRDVVSWARDEWERVQHDLDAFDGGPARWLSSWPLKRTAPRPDQPATSSPPLDELIAQVVRAKVEECRGQRRLNSSSLPPDTDNLGRLTANLLAKCLGRPEYSLVGVEQETRARRSAAVTFEFFITERDPRRREVKTAVACLPGGHANSTTARLKRILESPAKVDHVLVVTDERRAFKLGPAGQKHYDELGRRPRPTFRRVALSIDHVIELDALDSVLGMARVGDLEVEHPPGVPRAVSEAEAAEAMHRLKLFVNHPFLHELLTEGDPPIGPDVAVDPLADPEIRTCIKDFLPWRYAAHATEVVDKLLDDHPRADRGALLRQVTRIADMMHVEGMLKATPLDEDRHLLWKGGME